MEPSQQQMYNRRRKRPELAWLLTAFFGIMGAHLYYLKHPGRGLLRTAFFVVAILPKILYSSTHNPVAFYIMLLCATPLVVFSLIELMTVARRTQELNVLTARSIAGSVRQQHR